MNRISVGNFIVLFLVSSIQAMAAEGGVDKSKYHLFNPTPKSEMREFSTDRPDKTESPYSVDAGHFQFETDLVNFAHDKGDVAETKTYNLNLINLKMGMTNCSDLQLILGYVRQIQYTSAARTTDSSISDITLRYKINLIGNDEGKFSFGLMPYAVLPTAKDGLGATKVEGGLVAPMAYELPAGWGLGSMLVLGAVRNAADDGYTEETTATVTVGHDIVENLGFYIELFGSLAFEKGSALDATLDAGLTYEFVKDWQLDAGFNYGLTSAAVDYNPFLGLSARF